MSWDMCYVTFRGHVCRYSLQLHCWQQSRYFCFYCYDTWTMQHSQTSSYANNNLFNRCTYVYKLSGCNGDHYYSATILTITLISRLYISQCTLFGTSLISETILEASFPFASIVRWWPDIRLLFQWFHCSLTKLFVVGLSPSQRGSVP